MTPGDWGWSGIQRLTLGATIAELCEGGVEQAILLPERLFRPFDMCFLNLKLHIGVRNFRDVTDEEQKGEGEGKGSDSKIDPLHRL